MAAGAGGGPGDRVGARGQMQEAGTRGTGQVALQGRGRGLRVQLRVPPVHLPGRHRGLCPTRRGRGSGQDL